MHLASASLRRWITLALLSTSSSLLPALASADRVPLVGTGSTSLLNGPSSVRVQFGRIVPVEPGAVFCPQVVTFSEVPGGPTPGTNYDGILVVDGLHFAERFAGQSVGASGDFDVISGAPSSPLLLQAGAAGQNLDVFDYAGNLLAGLGAVGFPDMDAIGEGSIAIHFQLPQARVKLDLLGGNGGSASLRFYRADGSLIDDVLISGLADLPYGFGTLDGSYSISGILIQNTDASGIGVDNLCFDAGPVSARPLTWGTLKQLYR